MLLVIDTTGDVCSTALYQNGLLARLEHYGQKGHAEMLLPQVKALMQKADQDIKTVNHILVTVGPGSFTGVRVGLAAAKGLALSLGATVAGITSFAAMAFMVQASAGADGFSLKNGDQFSVVLDARRGEVYTQSFTFEGADKNPKPIDEGKAVAIEQAKETYGKAKHVLVGSGAKLIAEQSNSFFAEETFEHIISGVFGGCFEQTLVAVSTTPLTPLYLRKPDAKPGFSFLEKGAAAIGK